MASNEGHIHWNTLSPITQVNYAEQDLELTAETSNMANVVKQDPGGTVRIRAAGFGSQGLAIPTEGWQAIPGTSPTLQARADAADQVGYIRIRVA